MISKRLESRVSPLAYVSVPSEVVPHLFLVVRICIHLFHRIERYDRIPLR